MRNFKNNFRRNRYKNHSDRNNHRNENGKIMNDLQNGSNFIRKNAGRNNHNAPKLIEKYSNLAREALSNGDKILSENYFQHADHFTRILNDQDAQRKLNSQNSDHSKSQQNIAEADKELNETDDKKAITQIK